MKKLTLITLLIPFSIFAQQSIEDIMSSLNQNEQIIEQLAQLGPMSINPYLTLFITSLLSKYDVHNEYIMTNPIFASWIVLVIAGFLFSSTAIVKLLGDKLTGPIRTVANFLDNKAALLITSLIILAPTFTPSTTTNNYVHLQSAFGGLDFQTILLIAGSLYFLIVVMSVRLFLEILIFLSPIPIIDTAFEILKISLTIGFVLLSIFFPVTSFVLSILMFLISLVFYRKAKRLIQKTQYLIIAPIIGWITNRPKKEEELDLKILHQSSTLKIGKSKVFKLIKEGSEYFLVSPKRWFRSQIKQKVNLRDCEISQALIYSTISNGTDIYLLINASYHQKINSVADYLEIPLASNTSTQPFKKRSIWSLARNTFNSKQKTDLKTILK